MTRIVDLRTGKLRAHSRDDMMTICAPASLEDWTATAGVSVWSTFLERILPNEDTRLFVQKCVGLSPFRERSPGETADLSSLVQCGLRRRR